MKINRRTFFKTAGAAAALSALPRPARAFVPAHNWDGYDFGGGPPVSNRLNQGPFPIYAPEEVVPGSHVVMATTPSREPVPNFGMGLVTYLCDEAGWPVQEGVPTARLIEELVAMPLGDKLYIRLDWRDIQKRPGRLDFPDNWKIAFEMAEKYNKRIALRVQLMSPVIEPHSAPDFVAEKTPFVRLGTTDQIGIPGKVHYAPRYDDPHFMNAVKEMDSLLAEQYNGHPLVEYVDTLMYGFWGEGHTWPFEGHPFPDDTTAERTFVEIFEHQRRNWDRTPLTTNTQPDWSRVGNSEILDRTIRSHNWLRTDTIYIENMQIEALSNRPAWTGATIEQGMSDGTPETLRISEGVPRTDNVVAHVKDVAAHYWSLWNWHRIRADRVMNYYNQYPDAIDDLRRHIGYRVRPSWVWAYEKDGYPGLILGMVNDGIAAVPGVLYLTVFSEDGTVNVGGGIDAGYPLPRGVRQCQLVLPKGSRWEGLRLKAELEVKGQRYPVRFACHQETNADGSLTLRRNI